MKRHEILVPLDAKHHYAVSPENRKSATIIQRINAAGEYPPPPMVIIQGQDLMINWFSEDLPSGTHHVPSDSGFTSDEIAVEYLKHFIKNSDAGPDAEWKLMLMDNHGSHTTPEFVDLANENHIRPYPLIPHLTHCMQPLDVGVFQPYKHWHNVAIQEAISESFIEYSLTQFLKDLTKIRNNTFKASTIRNVFEKSGIWPVNSKICIKQLKTFNSESSDLTDDRLSLPLPSLPRQIHPQEIPDIEYGLDQQWGPKIQDSMQWSDPIRAEEFNSFINNSKEVVSNSLLEETELKVWQKTRMKELHSKKFSRKRLRPVSGKLGLTKENVEQALATKL